MSENKTPTPKEARNILNRFNASHFRRNDLEQARYSIPARPDHDDDLQMMAFIEDYERLEKQNQDLRAELDAAREALAEYGYIVSFLKGASSRYLMTPSCNNEKELRAAIGTNLTLPLPPQAASEQEND